jgi:hypothetical protein
MHKPIVGPGLCECGCGQATTVASRTFSRRNVRTGQHFRFVYGHGPLNGPVAFWSKVPRHLDPDDCWPWQGHRDVKGYGHFGGQRATLLVYEEMVGAVPAGLHMLHRCDNPPCVNPAHLFLGTNADNVADRCAKGRSANFAGRKLSDDQVAEIEARWAAGGIRQGELAAEYGISRPGINNILSGKRYRIRRAE